MFKATMGHIVRNGFKTNGKILKLSTKEEKKKKNHIQEIDVFFKSLNLL